MLKLEDRGGQLNRESRLLLGVCQERHRLMVGLEWRCCSREKKKISMKQ